MGTFRNAGAWLLKLLVIASRQWQLFAAGEALADCQDVVVLKLVNGKLTYVHKRLWPALVAVASTLAPERLARVRSVHTDKGLRVLGARFDVALRHFRLLP